MARTQPRRSRLRVYLNLRSLRSPKTCSGTAIVVGAQRANDGAAIFGVITSIATMIVGCGVITTDAIVIQAQRL